jgi:hypothetical protein
MEGKRRAGKKEGRKYVDRAVDPGMVVVVPEEEDSSGD